MSSVLIAQVTSEDFTNKYTEIYLNTTDTLKAAQLTAEAFEMLEENESLQEPGNYYILRSIFETVLKDEEMAQ